MESKHIRHCTIEIEKRLEWGPSEHWTNQDFELLAEDIFSKTGTNLSITTLKRIWGKIDYQSNPSLVTLNVLAQFIGYAHWRDFKNASNKENTFEKKPNAARPGWHSKKYLNQKLIILLVVAIAFSSVFFLIDRRQVFYHADEVIFKSKKVDTGLPNTVIFEYDVINVIADSFHIQQSWDRRRRVRISADDRMHTSFYYYPGYFRAKLIANSQIIKEHDIFVESDGWISMVERFPEPIYINDLLTVSEGFLHADIINYPQQEDHFQDKDFWLDYYYVKDLGNVDATNFIYECRIKNDANLGSVCRESRISVMCSNGRFNIPLCMRGCVSNINLALGDVYLSGKRHDLSSLGCNVTKWVNFKLKVEDKKCEISIENEVRLTKTFSSDIGKIVGFKFKFNGVGKVDHVKLQALDQSIIFEETFDQNL